MNERNAVIVGASRGIGQALAIHLSRIGYKPLLVARDEGGLEETSQNCLSNTHPVNIVGDVTEDISSIISRIEEHVDAVHLLWLGSAGYSEAPLSQTPVDEIKSLIRSGYESQVELVNRMYPLLKAGRAHIFGACSDWSDFHSGGPSVFGSTKVALAGFLDKLREEVREDGIKVTALKMGSVGNLGGYSLDEWEQQVSESGEKYVSLKDVCEAVEFAFSRKSGIVSELTIIPFSD